VLKKLKMWWQVRRWSKQLSPEYARVRLDSFPSLREALGKSPSPAAFQLHQARALATLTDFITVQRQAAAALGASGSPMAVKPLIRALGGASAYASAYAAEALAKLGACAVGPLIKALGNRANKRLRAMAAEALGHMGDPRALEPLVKALRDEESDVAERAAEALGRLGDPRAFEPLHQGLRDARYLVRMYAASALGKLGDRRALEALRAVLGEDEEWAVRRDAACALGQLGDARAFDAVLNALGDKHAQVRAKAATALGQLHDPRAVEPLIEVLRDAKSDVRMAAAAALGQLRDARAVDAVVKALGDPEERVRKAATEALRELGDPRAVGPLIEALRDHQSDIRVAATEALPEQNTASRAKDPPSQSAVNKVGLLAIQERVVRTDMLPHNASGMFRSFYNRACALHKDAKYADAERAFTEALNAAGTSAFERMLAAYARAKTAQSHGGAVVIPPEFQNNPEVCGNVFIAVTVACHLVRDGHQAVAWGKDDWNVAARVDGNVYRLTFCSHGGAFMNAGTWLQASQDTGLFEAAKSAGKSSPHSYVLSLLQDVTQQGSPVAFPDTVIAASKRAVICAGCGNTPSTAWHCRKCDAIYCPDCTVPASGSPTLKEFHTDKIHVFDTTDHGSRPTCPQCGSSLGSVMPPEPGTGEHVIESKKEGEQPERKRAVSVEELAARYMRQNAAEKPGGALAEHFGPRRKAAGGKRTLILTSVSAAIVCGGAIVAVLLWPPWDADSAGKIDSRANPAGKAAPTVAQPPKRHFDEAAYRNIAYGMTREQVEGLLGKGTEMATGKTWTRGAGQPTAEPPEPPPDIPVRMRIVMWSDADRQIWVTFVDDKVDRKEQKSMPTR